MPFVLTPSSTNGRSGDMDVVSARGESLAIDAVWNQGHLKPSAGAAAPDHDALAGGVPGNDGVHGNRMVPDDCCGLLHVFRVMCAKLFHD
jgi:hypothetical protein